MKILKINNKTSKILLMKLKKLMKDNLFSKIKN